MTNRPEWCPADVWADAVHRAGGEEFAYPATVDAIARAVMAERERCSGVAKNRWKEWGHTKKDTLWRLDVASCDDISIAILRGSP